MVVKSQLKRLGAISYADLTNSQVNELRDEGYTVQLEMIDQLLETTIQSQSVPWGVDRVRAEEAWTTTRGEGVKVCVIDTGLDTGHEDLADNFVAGRNTVDDNDNVEPDHYHGTHVAGTIAAVDNELGVVGVAPDVDLYIVNAYSSSDGGLPESAILEGIEWCIEQGVDVINMSFGSQETTEAKNIGYQAAYDAGIILVAASGNSGASKTIKYPARYPFTLAVGSVTSANNIASYSQRGPELDVVAPGEGINSTEPDDRYRIAGGTSMASPHVAGVAGVAALLVAQTKASGLLVDVDTIKEQINTSAVDLGDVGRDDTFGYGRVDARAALDQQPCDDCTYAPSAAFSYEIEALTVTFTNSSSDRDGNLVAYLWDFGDGASSNEENPVHTYADFGSYTITLTVTDNDGEVGEGAKQVEILDVPGGKLENSVTEINISADKSTEYHYWLDVDVLAGQQLENIRFETSGGTGDVDLYVRYGAKATKNDWDYRPYKSGNNEEVVVKQDELQAGRWYVMLRAYSNYSGVDLLANYQTNGELVGPDAQFTYQAQSTSIEFTDASTDSDGTIESWSWDFGDGQVSSEQNPTHVYQEDGSYTVSLAVTDNDGLTATHSISVTVSCDCAPTEPVADFNVQAQGLLVNFTDASSDDGDIVAWTWDFGDGNSSNLQSPEHSYAEANEYQVTLIVTDNDGLTAAKTQSVNVIEMAEGESYSNDQALVISDNNWLGVKSSIAVDRVGDSGQISLEVKINHDDPDQLLVKLRAPDGTKWYVHQYEDGNVATGIDKLLSFDAAGIDSNGTWKLYLYDRTNGVEGKLDSWTISFP